MRRFLSVDRYGIQNKLNLMESYENLAGIVNALYQRKKAIIGITFLTIVLAAGLSLLLPNYYAAETIFYAASPDLAKPSPIGVNEKKMDYYGESEDMDRLFSLALSSELRGKLIQQFNLYDHFKIDKDSKNAEFRIGKKIDQAFTLEKTKYDAFRLSIEDKNPILSRDMTNFARDFINTKAQSLIKDTQKKLLLTFEQNISQKKKDIGVLNIELDSLRNKYEIYDTKSQGQVIAEQLSKSQSKLQNLASRLDSYQSMGIYRDSTRILGIQKKALNSQISLLKRQAKNYNAGLASVVSLENQQNEASDQLGIDIERYKLLKSTFETSFDAVHVVEFANKPLRKSRPKRSILVLAAGLAAFLITSLAAIAAVYSKKVNWKEVLRSDK